MNTTLQHIYDGFAQTYDAGRDQFDMSAVLPSFFNSLNPPHGQLLDLGCGAGVPFPQYFIQQGWEVVGVDFSSQMLELAARTVPAMKTECADMDTVQFKPDSFDAITAIYSLFHIPREQHAELFIRFYRWLRPGGRMLFTYATQAYTGADTFEGTKEFMGKRLFYSHLTPEQMDIALGAAGFNIESAVLRNIGGESFLWVAVHKPDA
jgi:cyclopropane fatty-acyl-phospholipid synthase-like methyltransferase